MQNRWLEDGRCESSAGVSSLRSTISEVRSIIQWEEFGFSTLLLSNHGNLLYSKSRRDLHCRTGAEVFWIMRDFVEK
jgi:hypothetical protein